MSTELRCDKCGKALFVEDPPGSRVVCPNCHAELMVPAETDRPVPPVKPDEGAAAPSEPAAQDAEVALHEEGELSERAVVILSAALPWGVSVVFHAGVFLVLLFLFTASAIVEDPEAERIIIPDARLSEDPGAMIDPGQQNVELQAERTQRRTKKHKYRKQPAKDMLADVSSKKQSDLKIIGIGMGAGGGPSAYDLSTDGGEGPKASFYGSGGNAYKICYVIDRSGSLLDTFDYLRDELKRSIRSLKPQQQFHVIFFTGGRPEEMEARKLVYATPGNKQKAFKYLDGVVPGGQTAPGAALERAFKYHPELIFLMTDGDFSPDVLDRLRKLNRDKKIKINTLSFVFKPGEELLKQIAKEHGGTYRHVDEDDLGQ